MKSKLKEQTSSNLQGLVYHAQNNGQLESAWLGICATLKAPMNEIIFTVPLNINSVLYQIYSYVMQKGKGKQTDSTKILSAKLLWTVEEVSTKMRNTHNPQTRIEQYLFTNTGVKKIFLGYQKVEILFVYLSFILFAPQKKANNQSPTL